jgi:hypothetical protein
VSVEIHSIRPLDAQRYDVVLEVDGVPLRIICCVASHGGRSYVQPEPDVFMTGKVPAREVVAAVQRYHRERAEGS